MSKRGVALVVLAVGAAWVPLPPVWVERLYSGGAYRLVQIALTSMSNLLAFPLFDVLMAGVIVGWLALAARDVVRARRRRRWQALGRIALRTLVWTSALYLAFLAVWGLNYRRTRIEDRLPFDEQAVSAAGVRRLAAEAVARVNALYGPAHAAPPLAEGTVDAELAVAFAQADREVNGGGPGVVPGRPKTTALGWYFKRAAVDGMIAPYFLEILVSNSLLPIERPFVVAHEWSHLAGLADEGEANFLGWLACQRGGPRDQYSAWLFLYGQVASALADDERVELASRLDAGPRADLRAIGQRIAAVVNPVVSRAGWRVYDRYLKANRVEAGTASYAEVVRLVLGVRLDAARTR